MSRRYIDHVAKNTAIAARLYTEERARLAEQDARTGHKIDPRFFHVMNNPSQSEFGEQTPAQYFWNRNKAFILQIKRAVSELEQLEGKAWQREVRRLNNNIREIEEFSDPLTARLFIKSSKPVKEIKALAEYLNGIMQRSWFRNLDTILKADGINFTESNKALQRDAEIIEKHYETKASHIAL